MTCTDFRAGPVTDYTSSMVKWMRHRQPRYKGGGRMEMERPSPSYTVDVCSSGGPRLRPSRMASNCSYRIDAPTFCKASKRRRLCTCETPTLFLEQSQASNQCREMDPRRTSAVDRLEYWRVYAMEWYGLQLRDDITSRKCSDWPWDSSG